eukprot:scaffold2033_cov367-Prasinococcus_capsulatus_cf.AAC.4
MKAMSIPQAATCGTNALGVPARSDCMRDEVGAITLAKPYCVTCCVPLSPCPSRFSHALLEVRGITTGNDLPLAVGAVNLLIPHAGHLLPIQVHEDLREQVPLRVLNATAPGQPSPTLLLLTPSNGRPGACPEAAPSSVGGLAKQADLDASPARP